MAFYRCNNVQKWNYSAYSLPFSQISKFAGNLPIALKFSILTRFIAVRCVKRKGLPSGYAPPNYLLFIPTLRTLAFVLPLSAYPPIHSSAPACISQRKSNPSLRFSFRALRFFAIHPGHPVLSKISAPSLRFRFIRSAYQSKRPLRFFAKHPVHSVLPGRTQPSDIKK